MRPGRLTPENGATTIQAIARRLASMRPGRLTPENLRLRRGSGRLVGGFNEAGAINPGKQLGKNDIA